MVHDMILKVLSEKGHVWWCMPATPAMGRLRKEGSKFEASLNYMVTKNQNAITRKRCYPETDVNRTWYTARRDVSWRSYSAGQCGSFM